MQNASAIPCLISVLEDLDQEAMVRHEVCDCSANHADNMVLVFVFRRLKRSVQSEILP
jgi:hypothetical protein